MFELRECDGSGGRGRGFRYLMLYKGPLPSPDKPIKPQTFLN